MHLPHALNTAVSKKCVSTPRLLEMTEIKNSVGYSFNKKLSVKERKLKNFAYTHPPSKSSADMEKSAIPLSDASAASEKVSFSLYHFVPKRAYMHTTWTKRTLKYPPSEFTTGPPIGVRTISSLSSGKKVSFACTILFEKERVHNYLISYSNEKICFIRFIICVFWKKLVSFCIIVYHFVRKRAKRAVTCTCLHTYNHTFGSGAFFGCHRSFKYLRCIQLEPKARHLGLRVYFNKR